MENAHQLQQKLASSVKFFIKKYFDIGQAIASKKAYAHKIEQLTQPVSNNQLPIEIALIRLSEKLEKNPINNKRHEMIFAISICKHLAMQCRDIPHISFFAPDLIDLSQTLIALKKSAPPGWGDELNPAIQQLRNSYQNGISTTAQKAAYPVTVNWYLGRFQKYS